MNQNGQVPTPPPTQQNAVPVIPESEMKLPEEQFGEAAPAATEPKSSLSTIILFLLLVVLLAALAVVVI